MISSFSNAGDLAALSARLCGIGILIQSLEVAWNWREFPNRRLLGWRGSGRPARGPVARSIRWLHRPPVVLPALLGRALAAGAILIAPPGTPFGFGLLTVLLLGQLYYNRRFYDIVSNADCMYLTCLAGLWVGSLPGGSARLQTAGLLFIAFHALLAYFGTGKNKLVTANWRDGTRLMQIFQHGAHRFAPLGRIFARQPRLATVVSWSVILLELLFPMGLWLPDPMLGAWLVAGLLFHGAVAFTMGLHDFFWAFAATYPALWFAHACVSAAT